MRDAGVEPLTSIGIQGIGATRSCQDTSGGIKGGKQWISRHRVPSLHEERSLLCCAVNLLSRCSEELCCLLETEEVSVDWGRHKGLGYALPQTICLHELSIIWSGLRMNICQSFLLHLPDLLGSFPACA